MELIRGLHNIRPRHRGCVLTIGNFDGVHRGHQAIIKQLAEVAERTGLPSLFMTFEPQPQEFFAPDKAPPRLSRLREKLELLHTTALDRVLCVRFDKALATMTADDFISHLLVERLGIKYMVIGDDFRFGRARAGDARLLRQAGKSCGFEVHRSATYTVAGERVSSTRVREALADDQLDLVAELLGRRYSVWGRVAYGDQLGRTIGFPTANVLLRRRSTALAGVYAVQVLGLADGPLPGVANLGKRPTVGGLQTRLEVHLFDYNEQIYGRPITVEFLQKIRPEQRFESLDALKQQIQHDAEQARAYFAATAGRSVQ